MKDDKRPTVPSKIADARLDELLDRLERQSTESAGGKGQRERRWTYRRPGLVANIEHPGGGFAKVTSHPISLWCEGIYVLMSGFTYPGSSCSVLLTTKDGESFSTKGVVASCQHVERVLHSVEIKFAQRVDPHLFIDTPRNASGDPVTQIELPNLHGKILHVDDSEFDAKLLAHQLRGSNIELKAVKTPQEALTAFESAMFDIVLCDLNLGAQHDSAGLIQSLRSAGFLGPIVILSAENHPDKLTAAKVAGASHTLAKPYGRNTLIQTMIRLHQEVGAITTGEVLYSTLGDQDETEELLSDYVKAAKAIAKNIQAGIIGRDFDTVRELCLNLKGSASGYGFAPLGLAAEEALKALDATQSVEEAKPKLRMLMLLCDHLGLRKNASVAA